MCNNFIVIWNNYIQKKQMKVIIMCGGVYDNFTTPKQLSVINGETLVERTIRLLKENGINDIYISSNDDRFSKYAPLLKHTNTYK